MNMEQAVDLVREAFILTLIASAPILAAAVLVGLIISIFQAVTQIQEQTLTFVPKIVAMLLVAIVLTPWMAQMLMEFSQRMFGSMN